MTLFATNKRTKISCILVIVTLLSVGLTYLILDQHYVHGDAEWTVLIAGVIIGLILVLAGSIVSFYAFLKEQTILSGICLFLFLSVIVACIFMLSDL